MQAQLFLRIRSTGSQVASNKRVYLIRCHFGGIQGGPCFSFHLQNEMSSSGGVRGISMTRRSVSSPKSATFSFGNSTANVCFTNMDMSASSGCCFNEHIGLLETLIRQHFYESHFVRTMR